MTDERLLQTYVIMQGNDRIVLEVVQTDYSEEFVKVYADHHYKVGGSSIIRPVNGVTKIVRVER